MTLLDAIAEAERALESNPDGQLPLANRRRIWKAMGPAQMQPFHGKRIELAVRCVQYVLPLWEKSWPKDRTPHKLLEANGRKQLEEVGILNYDDAWTYMDDMVCENQENQNPIAVGYAAAKVLNVISFDEYFDDAADPEEELEPDMMDTAWMAAAAYSFGPIWVEGSNRNRRSEFWTWWLRAVAEV